jgi:hypothetical protein
MLIPLELRFHPLEKSKLSNKDYSSSLDPKVYYRIDDFYYFYNGSKYFSITYYLYFQENYAIGLNGLFLKSEALGYHLTDIENIRILYNIDSYTPEYVFFSSHAQEGIWKKFNDCIFNNNKLVIYVSLSSHALRPLSKVYLRMFGLANDYCSNYGDHITPILIKDQSIPYLKVQNEEVFATGFKAFIMPLIVKNKENLKLKQRKKEIKINKHLYPQLS